MTKESKQQTAYAPAQMMYTALSSFENLTPMLQGKVEEWSATADTCTFKVQGMTLGLKMDREAMAATMSQGNYTIKVVADNAPLDFSFWLQLKEVGAMETRLRVVAEMELNMMMKMMIGSKIQTAVDTLAEQIASGFNLANR